MTDVNMFDEHKLQNKQIGGSHYMYYDIQPYEFISKNNLSFFQGNVVKYVCRYLTKNGIEDLEKIIHYCELEIKKMKDRKRTRLNSSHLVISYAVFCLKKKKAGHNVLEHARFK